MDCFLPRRRRQVLEYFARMNAKARKPDTLTREELWKQNVEILLARWPKDEGQTFKKLATLAGIRYETISRLADKCPLTDDPSPALRRLCAVLGVTPTSLLTSHLEIVSDVTTEFAESARRIDELKITSSNRTAKSTSDIETMFRFSSLKPGDKAVVRELINRLSQLTNAANASQKLPERDQPPDAQTS